MYCKGKRAPCDHTSNKSLRYGTRSQGISQFYLHTPRTSANGMNHTIPVYWYTFAGKHFCDLELVACELRNFMTFVVRMLENSCVSFGLNPFDAGTIEFTRFLYGHRWLTLTFDLMTLSMSSGSCGPVTFNCYSSFIEIPQSIQEI